MTDEGSVVRLLGERGERVPGNLPPPAVKAAYRLAQLARQHEMVTVQVVIARGEWWLQYNGQHERLGDG